jgi:hypothetical protein
VAVPSSWMFIWIEASPAMSMTSVRIAELRADRGGQAIAHRAEPAEVSHLFGLEEREILRRPHLVLADFGGDDRIAVLGQLIQPLDRQLRHDRGLARVGQALARAPFVDCGLSFHRSGLAPCGCPRLDQLFQHRAAIADDRQVDRTVLLIEARSISMWIFFELGEKASSRPVTRSSKRAPMQTIRSPVHRHIGFIGAVHAQHAQPVGMIGREGAKAHQRRGDRRAGQFLQFWRSSCACARGRN